MINLHHLRLFVAVVREGGFSRAGDALAISQPAVSRAVRELEADLECRLLERRGDGVIVTEAGRRLLDHAFHLFAAERAAEEEMAALRGLETGSLRIGASTTIGTWYLPPLLARFHTAHPGVTLQLRTGNTARIAEWLLARDLDVALVEGPITDASILTQPWIDDRLVWIAAPSHPLCHQPPPLPAEVLAHELIIVREPGSGTRDIGRQALAAMGVPPGEILEVGGTEAIKQVVAAGLGLALVSEAAVRGQTAPGRLAILEIEGIAPTRTFSRLSLPDRPITAAAVVFNRILDDRATTSRIGRG